MERTFSSLTPVQKERNSFSLPDRFHNLRRREEAAVNQLLAFVADQTTQRLIPSRYISKLRDRIVR